MLQRRASTVFSAGSCQLCYIIPVWTRSPETELIIFFASCCSEEAKFNSSRWTFTHTHLQVAVISPQIGSGYGLMSVCVWIQYFFWKWYVKIHSRYTLYPITGQIQAYWTELWADTVNSTHRVCWGGFLRATHRWSGWLKVSADYWFPAEKLLKVSQLILAGWTRCR